MRYASENITQANHACAGVFKLLEQHGIPPTPDLYKLIYDYVTDRNDIPKGQVERALKGGADKVRELCQNFGDSDTQVMDDAVVETGNKINQKVEEILLTLASHSSSTGGFSDALTNFSGNLKGAGGAAAVEKLVHDIMAETHAMRERTQHLELELQNSASAIDDLQSSLKQVQAEALTDQLTKITNRLGFDRTLAEKLEESATKDRPLCLVMCDVDHFKKFNDTYGHQMGDQVLRMVGAALKDNTKGQDLAARYGGEEFSLVLPDTELDNAILLADTIREAIGSKRLIRKKTGEEISRVTMSFGAAVYRPGEGASDLIERADAALYHAKQTGRNRVCCEREHARSQIAVAG